MARLMLVKGMFNNLLRPEENVKAKLPNTWQENPIFHCVGLLIFAETTGDVFHNRVNLSPPFRLICTFQECPPGNFGGNFADKAK